MAEGGEKGSEGGAKGALIRFSHRSVMSLSPDCSAFPLTLRMCLRFPENAQNPTIPSFLRAHAYSHYSLRPYPPRFDASKPLYSLAGVDDAPAMMWASFARMCCRSGVEEKQEMVGAVQGFLSRWLRASSALVIGSYSSKT